MGSESNGRSTSTEPTAEQRKAKILSDVRTVKEGLDSLKVRLTGDSMGHIKFTLEFFNAAATLVQDAQTTQLTDSELAEVVALHKILVTRQKQTFPVMRDKIGPIFGRELWASDAEAHTVGARYQTIQFVSGDFAANRNILRSHQAILSTLVRLRFKRAEYRWYREADEFTYFKIESPDDADVGVVDEQGNLAAVRSPMALVSK